MEENKIADMMINSYDIIKIELNPEYATQDDFNRIKNAGVPVCWMQEDERSDKNIFTITVDEDD